MNNNIASKHTSVGPKLGEGLPDKPEGAEYVQPAQLRNLNLSLSFSLVPTLK